MCVCVCVCARTRACAHVRVYMDMHANMKMFKHATNPLANISQHLTSRHCRITMELKQDVTPKTAKNFEELCAQPAGQGYKGSK